MRYLQYLAFYAVPWLLKMSESDPGCKKNLITTCINQWLSVFLCVTKYNRSQPESVVNLAPSNIYQMPLFSFYGVVN